MPQFLDPSMLWWLAAGIPAITILYFLRLKRQPRTIASTLLWRRSVYDLRVNAPVQMIRRNLLLLLQLLIIIAAIIALARPFTKLLQGQGRQSALIIDCSASMGTKDGPEGTTRLDAAKAEALRLIEELGIADTGGNSDDQLCIILAADRPQEVCPLTNDKNRLRRAVEGIQQRQTYTDMRAALEMAVAVTGVANNLARMEAGSDIKAAPKVEGQDESQIGRTEKGVHLQANVVILSDGIFDDIPTRLSERIAAPAQSEDQWSGSRYIRLGEESSNNIAIVSADLRTDPAGIEERQIFVRVENMGSVSRSATLQLDVNGAMHDRKRFTIPPRTAARAGMPSTPGQTGVDFSLAPDTVGKIVIKLDAADDKGDAMLVDNQVNGILAPAEPIRCLLVTDEPNGHYFIDSALAQLHKTVSYNSITSAAYKQSFVDGNGPKSADGRSYEVVIFDRFAPALTPSGASFYIDALPADLPGIKQARTAYVPQVIDWKRTHPTMRYLTLLDNLMILKARALQLSGGWATLIDGQGLALENAEDLSDTAKLEAADVVDTPLLATLVTENRRVAVLAFDIFNTQRWVMRVSFPLFIRNTVHWLARPGGLQRAMIYRTGETLRAQFDEPVSSVTIKTPDGNEATATPSSPHRVYFSETRYPGFYAALAPGQPEQSFAYSLLSSKESDNAAQSEILLGEDALSATPKEQKRNTDLWPYLALFALGFLLLEWYIYNRRILG